MYCVYVSLYHTILQYLLPIFSCVLRVCLCPLPTVNYHLRSGVAVVVVASVYVRTYVRTYLTFESLNTESFFWSARKASHDSLPVKFEYKVHRVKVKLTGATKHEISDPCNVKL